MKWEDDEVPYKARERKRKSWVGGKWTKKDRVRKREEP